MRIHHLNCMTFYLGVPAITHCLLLETDDGLVLVDTGLGIDDHDRPSRITRVFKSINRISSNTDETAIEQVDKLGYSPQDVRHIILTHLHLDHSGGLTDFSWAKVHVHAAEHDTAQKRPAGLFHRFGYDAAHWVHGPKWVTYETFTETWFGLPCAEVQGIQSMSILLVPLIGHSPGHCGVAVEIDGGWIMHGGDAYVRPAQIDPRSPRSPFPKWARVLEKALFPTQALEVLRVLQSEHEDEITMFAAHDPIQFRKLSTRQ